MGISARRLVGALVATVLVAGAGWAQTSEGRLFGTVQDPDGAPLPGVTVTISSPAMLGTRTAVSGSGGGFRFPALPPGTYTVRFELSGFKTLVREGIVIPAGTTITLSVTMELAAVEEVITVTGESPVVDIKTTDVGSSFTAQQLVDVPTATDVWSVLGMTPGVRMRSYDVGGSHKSQQLGYESFGFTSQNRIMTESIDSTEGGGGTGFYFDYFNKSDVQVVGANADVEMTTMGTFVIQRVKSGGNEFHGLFYQTYEPSGFVGDNVDADTRARGFTGNPNELFWETHLDLGGPVARDRLWFFGAANFFVIDKQISGVDPGLATDRGEFYVYSGKVTWRPTEKDQFVGFGYWQLKQKPNRGLSSTVPPESILAQNSWSRMWKGEWQRTWSDSLYTSIMAGVMGFSWPMVPAVDPKTNPPRVELTTGQVRGAGFAGTSVFPFFPFTFNRYKPQSRGSAYYYTEGVGGSHDFKFGYDIMVDSAQFGFNTNSGLVMHRFRDGQPVEVLLTNRPVFPDDRAIHYDFYVQDTWTIANRATFNVGVRFQRQRAYYKDAEVKPVLSDFFESTSVQGQTVASWNKLAPRIGLTFDVLNDGTTVVKAAWGRYYWNVNDDFSRANPVGQRTKLFEWNDLNGNGVWDGPQELGALLADVGGAATQVDSDIELPFGDQWSFSIERQFWGESAIRVGYVRKTARGQYAVVNLAREGNLTRPFQAIDPGPDGVVGTGDDAVLNLVTIPSELVGVFNNVLTNAPDTDAEYDNFEIAFQKRFPGQRAFVLFGFDYGWRTESVPPSQSRSPLSASPIGQGYFLNVNPNVPRIQDSTTWGFKFVGRYTLPGEVGFGINGQINSGFNWARLITVRPPGMGTTRIWAEPIKNNRSETVPLVNIRVDKRFEIQRGAVTVFGDVYNILNANPELNFLMFTGRRFREIIQALDPITLMIGARYEF